MGMSLIACKSDILMQTFLSSFSKSYSSEISSFFTISISGYGGSFDSFFYDYCF